MSRRRALLAVLVAALPWVAALSPSPARADPTKPPSLGVAVTACQPGLHDTDRLAVFTASMPSVPEGVTMAMRFDLEERLRDDGPFVPLPAPNFGRWERSEPNVAGFVYAKRVRGLRAPAAYRVKVSFRWMDATGSTVRTAGRTSVPCEQPDERPDLRVTRLRIGEGSGDTGLYSVAVRNVGATDVPTPFTISLSVGGAPQQAQEVGALAAGASVSFVFRGARCTVGDPVVARVDAGRTVDEADERDNVARTTCPGR